MTDREPDPQQLPPLPEEVQQAEPSGGGRFSQARKTRDPAATLNTAMMGYIFVNLLFGLPLMIFPGWFFDVVGVNELVAAQMDGLRWVGGAFLAWAVSGILVLARPGGRAIFVTTGALQMSFVSLALLYTWSVNEYDWSLWYQIVASVVAVASAVYLWWARLWARGVLSGKTD